MLCIPLAMSSGWCFDGKNPRRYRWVLWRFLQGEWRQTDRHFASRPDDNAFCCYFNSRNWCWREYLRVYITDMFLHLLDITYMQITYIYIQTKVATLGGGKSIILSKSYITPVLEIYLVSLAAHFGKWFLTYEMCLKFWHPQIPRRNGSCLVNSRFGDLTQLCG